MFGCKKIIYMHRNKYATHTHTHASQIESKVFSYFTFELIVQTNCIQHCLFIKIYSIICYCLLPLLCQKLNSMLKPFCWFGGRKLLVLIFNLTLFSESLFMQLLSHGSEKGGALVVQGLDCKQDETALPVSLILQICTWSHQQCILEHCHGV